MKGNFFLTRTGSLLLFLFCPVLLKHPPLTTLFVVMVTLCLLFPFVLKNRRELPVSLLNWSITIIFFLLFYAVINAVPFLYPLKYFSYIICFLFGYLICHRREPLYCKNKYIYIVTFIPIFMYISASSKGGGGLFDLANTYVYFGLAMSLFYYMYNYKIKESYIVVWAICGLYVVTATKLGIVVAILISYLLYSMRSLKHIVLYVGILICFIFAIIYVDIPLFVRIRGVYEFATNIPLEAYRNIGDSSAYEIGKLYGTSDTGENDTSFVFRLSHWVRLLNYWCDSDIIHILFGYGDLYVKEYFGLQPHNEYIKLLLENGIFVFVIFCVFVFYVYKTLKPLKIRYMLISPLIFMFSENILYFSFMNFIIFLSLGYFCCFASEKEIDKDNIHMYI